MSNFNIGGIVFDSDVLLSPSHLNKAQEIELIYREFIDNLVKEVKERNKALPEDKQIKTFYFKPAELQYVKDELDEKGKPVKKMYKTQSGKSIDLCGPDSTKAINQIRKDNTNPYTVPKRCNGAKGYLITIKDIPETQESENQPTTQKATNAKSGKGKKKNNS